VSLPLRTSEFSTYAGDGPVVATPATRRRRRLIVWGLALLLPAAAALGTIALRPYMERNIFLLFNVAIAVIGLAGGVWPGVAATLLSAVAVERIFLAPAHAQGALLLSDRIRLGAFVVIMVAVSALCGAFRRALRRVRAREEALRRSEADVRLLLTHASDAIIITDPAGRIVEANDVACALTGFAREDLLGRDALELVMDPDKVQRGPDEPRDRRATGARTEHRLRRHDGRVVDIEVAVTRFPDGRHLAIARDVTERAQMQARLDRAQRLEALGQLAGGVAHDFNNIVTAIRSSAELLLLDLPADGTQREDAEEIVRTCERATALTRQLLAYSRRRALAPALVEPDAVLRDMERMLVLLLGGGRVLRLALGAPGAAVLADRGQLEQVLLNLAVNARDAMPNGGSLTMASALRRDGAGAERLVVTVSDTGSGIPADVLAHIFEPFFTTRETDGGTGLGLATVRGVVEQLGGTIDVESAPARGTTFRVALPVAAREAERRDAAA
jgi:PAS domain S-box-containing protein